MQLLIIAGNIGKDPELRTTQSGDKLLSFSLAVDNGKDKSGEKRPATWFDCTVWGPRAESLGWLSKGMKLTVTGRPTARAHEGKAYLGISVDQITAHGGGMREPGEDRDERPAQPRPDLDDEIPF